MSLPDPQVFSDLSVTSLEELEMAAFGRASQLRKAVRRDLELWVEQWALASLARWMLTHKSELRLCEAAADKSVVDELLPDGR